MAIQVLKADTSVGDSYLELDLGSALGDWYLQVDFMIPATTFTALAGRNFTPDLVEVGEALDGFFMTGYGTDGSAHNFSFGNRNYWTEFDPGNPVDGSFTADAWHTLKINYISGTITWNIDGTDYFTYAIDLAGSDLFNLGGHFANHVASEVYYFDNFKLGTSDGGSEVLCDDFASGSFSLWSTVHGSGCSIVNDPLGTGGPSSDCSAGVLAANFNGSPTSGFAPLSVVFADTSSPGPSGPITSWAWDFGDGGTSTLQNPTHVYTSAGVYTVSLTITGTSPDGTASHTRSNYITVSAVPSNAICTGATNLHVPDCPPGSPGTITVGLADYPAGDGSGPAYDLYGCDVRHQAWYKLMNTSSVPAYARFDETVISTNPFSYALGACISLFLGSCAALTDPFTNAGDPDPFAAGDSETRCDLLLAAGGSLSTYFAGPREVGCLLQPGQTLYIQIGSQNDGGSFHTDLGVVELIWELVQVNNWTANTDQRQPISTGGTGGSDVLPANTHLDYSGFTVPAGTTSTDWGSPWAYRHFGGAHFTAVVATYHNSITGHIITELGAWQLAADGSQLGFYSVDTRDFRPGDTFNIHPDIGEFFDPGTLFLGHPRLETDGETLWLIVSGPATVINPYDLTLPPHPWNPHCVTVYAWNGGGFTKIGQLDALTSNLMSGGSTGGNVGRFAFNDAYASLDELGVLHVFMSEEGHLDGPSTDPADAYSFSFGGDYGILPREFATATQHATFDASTLTSVTAVYYDNAGTSQPADYGAVHDADGDRLQVRNEGGTPFFVRQRPKVGYASGGYQFLLDICAINGTVLSTIDSTFLGSNPTDFSLTRNTIIDPFDSRRVYLLSASGALKLVRLDVADLANPRYWQDSLASPSGSGLLLGSNSIHVSADNSIWVVRIGFFHGTSISQYDPCTQQWISRATSYPFSGPITYPGIVPESDISYWANDENVYYMGTFQSGLSTPDIHALCRTKIIPHFQICSIGDCALGSSGLHIWQTF